MPLKVERTAGEQNPGACDRYAKLFRTAQAKIERKHFRDRRILMYHERERRKSDNCSACHHARSNRSTAFDASWTRFSVRSLSPLAAAPATQC